MAMPAADIAGLAAGAIAALTHHPYFLRIPGFGDDPADGRALANLISFAPPAHPYKAFQRAKWATIRIDAEAFAKDGDGTRYSRTAEALAPHTDSSFLPHPHEYVSFQMAQPDPEGGESVIVTARDAVAALDAATRDRLRAPRFPFAGELRPILTGSEDNPCIRYYRRQIDEETVRATSLAAEDMAALDALDAQVERADLQHHFRLAAGEIVLLNNLRVLHGRTAMPAASSRLMYRVRAWAGCLL